MDFVYSHEGGLETYSRLHGLGRPGLYTVGIENRRNFQGTVLAGDDKRN
jgi:hypothetical protein